MLLSSCEHLNKTKKNDITQEDIMVQDISDKTVLTERGKNEKSFGESDKTKMTINIEQNLEQNIRKETSVKSSGNDQCFLCLNVAEDCCEKCLLPFCSEAHYQLHTTSNEDIIKGAGEKGYCFPFRVSERPEVKAVNI